MKPLLQQALKPLIMFVVLFIILVIGGFALITFSPSLLTNALVGASSFFGTPNTFSPINIRNQAQIEQSVLAATQSSVLTGNISFNLPAIFNNSVDFKNGLTVENSLNLTGDLLVNGKKVSLPPTLTPGTGISVGTGNSLTISNLGVLSFQGQTGTIQLIAGDGVTVDGLTIKNTGVTSLDGQTGAVSLTGGTGIGVSGATLTNTDPGTAQNIFKNIIIGTSTIVAGTNNDTLTLASGAGIALSTSGNTITVTNTTAGTVQYWQSTAGILAPLAITNDIAVGGISTASAKALFSGSTGNITTQGLLTVAGATNLASLTTSGNISDSGTLGVTGATTFSGSVTANGNVVLGSTNANTIIPNGVLAASLLPQSSSINLGSAGSPYGTVYATSFLTSGNGTAGFWQLAAGALSPANITNDLIIGSSATSGAKFQTSGTTGNTMVGGTLGVIGNTTLSTLSASGAITDGGALSVTGGSTLTGNTSIGGTLGVTGTTALSSLTTSGNITNSGNQTISGTLGVTGNTTVSNISASGNGTIGGTFSVTGLTSLAGLATSGNIADGGTLAVTGNTTVGGTLGVTGLTSLTGLTTSGNIIDSGNLSVTGTSTLTGNSTVGGTFGVTGNTTLSTLTTSSTITANGNETIAGTLGVTGNTTLSTVSVSGLSSLAGVTTSGNITDSGNLSVTGTSTLSGNSTVGGTFGVIGNTTLTGGLVANGNVTLGVDNTKTITPNGLFVTSLIPSTSSVNLGSLTNPYGSLYVNNIFPTPGGGQNGYLQLSNGILSPSYITNDLAIGGVSTASAKFQVSGTTGNTTVGGTFAVTGASTLTGNTTVGGTLGVTGSTSLAGLTTSGNIADSGALSVTSTTSLTGTLTANGNVVLGTNGSNTITPNGVLASSLLPQSSSINLGSAGSPYGTVYATSFLTSGNGTAGFWQLAAGALSPSNITNDLIIGSTATSGAKFQTSGTTGNTIVGGTLAVTGASTLTGNTTVGGTLGVTGNTSLSTLSTSGTITNNGSQTISGILGVTGNTSLSTLSTSGTITNGGNQTIAGTLGVTGASTLAGVTANSINNSGNTTLGTNATNTITPNGLFNLSLIPTSGGTINLGSGANPYGTLFVNNIVSTAQSGQNGFWQLALGALSPANITNDFLVGGNSTASAKFQIVSGTGNTTIAGTLGVTGASTLTGNTSVGGTLGVTGNTSLSTLSTSGNITDSGSETVAGTLGVTGNTSLSTLSTSGNITNNANQTIAGTLGVTGATTLASLITSGTVNGLTITNNGTNTLNIAAGKTLAVTNSLTLGGTDGTSFTLPTTSDTLVGRASTDTLTNKIIAAGSNTITGLTNANLSGSAGITNANLANSSFTVSPGTGMSGGGTVSLGGTITLTNAGVTAITGTTNQVVASGATGSVTLSLPQSINAGATPTFAALNLANTTNQLVLGTTNTVTISSLAPAANRTATIPVLSASDTFDFINQAQTLTNKTIAAGSNTITGLTNTNLSGSAGITNANLANSSLTVTAGTGLSGGGSVSLGGTVSLANSGVLSLTGTANQVLLTGSTGNITLSLPQNIGTGNSPTFAGETINSGIAINSSGGYNLTLTNSGGSNNTMGLFDDTSGTLNFYNNGGSSIFHVDQSGNLVASGNVAVQGGSLTTSQTTANLFNAIATTLNIGGAATTLNIGASTGTTAVKNSLTVAGNINVSGGFTAGLAVYNTSVANGNFGTAYYDDAGSTRRGFVGGGRNGDFSIFSDVSAKELRVGSIGDIGLWMDGNSQNNDTPVISLKAKPGADTISTAWNAAVAVMEIGKYSSTSRSIDAAGSINASGADYAEYFLQSSPGNLSAGDIVCLNDLGKVEKCSGNGTLIGVYSSDPSFVGGDKFYDQNNPNSSALVGLVGQITTKVSTEHGSIKIGDTLVQSSTAGVAMKGTSDGFVIGEAMEAYSAVGQGNIIVYVHPHWYSQTVQLTANGNLTGVSGAQIVPAQPPITTLDSLQQSVTTLQMQVASLSASATLNKTTASISADIQGQVDTLTKAVNLLMTTQLNGNPLAGSITSTAADTTTLTNNFTVTGKTTVADLGVTGTIQAGLLTIDGLNGTMNTLAGDLKFQSNGLNGVEFENGKLTIDPSGNLISQGSISAKQVITDKLTLITATSSASVGEATIQAGQVSRTISTTSITDASKIFVTSKTQGSGSIYVTNQVVGKSFTVTIDASFIKDILFNWWIVN